MWGKEGWRTNPGPVSTYSYRKAPRVPTDQHYRPTDESLSTVYMPSQHTSMQRVGHIFRSFREKLKMNTPHEIEHDGTLPQCHSGGQSRNLLNKNSPERRVERLSWYWRDEMKIAMRKWILSTWRDFISNPDQGNDYSFENNLKSSFLSEWYGRCLLIMRKGVRFQAL